ncbi:cysteine proteinase [Hortaea werneckii]|nr:cysteine proteinase [Hortaea werneckii]
MNHHMAAGPGQPPHMPAMPMHGQSRRQQDYHAWAQQQPHSPMHNPYATYPPPMYYPNQQPPYGYPPPRWQPPTPYQHGPYASRPQYPQPAGPMIVSSVPQPAPAMTPVTRHTPIAHPNPYPQAQALQSPAMHSPRPTPPQMPQPTPQQSQAQPPTAASPAPTPKQEPAPQPQQPLQTFDAVSTPSAPSAPQSRRQSQVQMLNPLALPPEHKTPYYPRLPWYSFAEGQSSFPPRAMARRRRRQTVRNTDDAVALPVRDEKTIDKTREAQVKAQEPVSETSTIAAPSEPETRGTSQAPSESDFTQVSTPATPAQAATSSPKVTPTQTHSRKDTRTAIAVPNLPAASKAKPSPPAAQQQGAKAPEEAATTPTQDEQSASTTAEPQAEQQEKPKETAAKVELPKSWADLVRARAGAGAAAVKTNGAVVSNGTQPPRAASLAEALRQYNVEGETPLSFLEPRGLVNTGNMCYMNSILQVLVFCAPFYVFLDQVRQRTVHSMKSETPLVDAMIMFMREFKVLGSAESLGVLRKTLNQQQLEQYGEPIIPEYVYDAIRKLPRFQSMRRGHQQDAEEFLGFLLEGLHDECVHVMQTQADEKAQANGASSPDAEAETTADGWLEVGKKQKAAVTRTTGHVDAPSPVTKIFGGHLRSELRVPGQKDSVTLEPYKPLQLDIGASHVNNIVDALKSITRTETLTGDFGGRSNQAKKQVFIDTLPPVLILHLKRFQYDSTFTGTQKIWKKVGYPLELEVPKEVFPPNKRGGLAIKGGSPKYRLISVVYHHGKSAAGGHYTVDVLRQDGREWVRMDDTVIRRIRPEDVAEGGAEEDPKVLAKALEQHKADQDLQKQRNMYQGLDEADREPEEEKPWSEVNGAAGGKKQWSSVANTNGSSTPSRTPTARKEGVKDNKVAYILLYERISE